MKKIILLLVAVAMVAAGLWVWLRGPLVSVARASRGTIAEIVYATGVVEPDNWSKVMPLLRARIVEHCACEGRQVRKGDVLAKLDDRAARAELQQIAVKRDFSANEVKRLTELSAQGAATRLALEKSETDLRQLDSQIAALNARLVDYLLLAPTDGTVLRADGQVGDIPSTTDVLFWVGDPGSLQIVADVNEEDIAKVVVGQKVLLRNDAFANAGLTAHLAAITPKGDPLTKTFRVYLGLGKETPLRIGMSVEANIVVREKADALLLPAEALHSLTAPTGNVQLVSGDTLMPREVRTGLRGGRLVEIIQGMDEGALVVSPYRTDLKVGQRIRIKRQGP